MKTLIISCFVCFSIITSFAQKLKESEVPTAVKSTFSKIFPKASGVKWSKESETEFEAEFKNGKSEVSANFNNAGERVVTETEIKKAELPSSVSATIKKEFAGYELEEAEKVEMPGKEMFYEVELEKGEVTYSVQIAADGKVLKKEEKKEDKKEKD